MNTENLIVLDFTTGVCTIYTINPKIVPVIGGSKDYENYISEKLGHNINQCQWMVTKEDIEYESKLDD